MKQLNGTTGRQAVPRTAVFVIGSALAAVIWAYWTTLADVADRWVTDPQYSHGFLVPLFALWLLWLRRGQLVARECQPRWWGLSIVVVAGLARIAGYMYYQPWLETLSLLLCLAGVAATIGGRKLLVCAMPAILFLAFMMPLPYRFQNALGGSLQRIATNGSTYLFQTLGVPAVSEGNVILLTETKLGVVEACSGLSMLYTFFALSTAVALLAPRTIFEKVLLVLSAVPIAVFANIVRITVTGLLIESSKSDLAHMVFHDLAGLLMMPLALGVLLLELFVLGRSLIPVASPNPVSR